MQMTFKVIVAAGVNPIGIGTTVIAEGGSWRIHGTASHTGRNTIFITCESDERVRVLRVLQSQAGVESVEKTIEIGAE